MIETSDKCLTMLALMSNNDRNKR